ncbi:MAG: BCCT family transporter [Pseudomonadales bacterium]
MMNITSVQPRVFNPAFVPIAVTAVLITAMTLIAPDTMTAAARTFSTRFMARWDVIYINTFSILVLAVFAIALSPLGRIRIGGVDAVTEFSRTTWIGMIFSGAMGGSLIGFSVYQPLEHLQHARLLFEGGATEQATANALAIYMWGFHGWGPWSLLAAAFAYASYNRSDAFGFKGIADVVIPARYPKSRTVLAGISDYAGIVSCWFSSSVGLALITQQVAGGVIDSFQLGATTKMLAPVVSAVTAACFVAVALSGLKSGIGRLSRYNFILAHLFLLAVFLLCNPIELLWGLVSSVVAYGKLLFTLPFILTGAQEEAVREFRLVWPASFLLWWLGMSVIISAYFAKISYGRTVREVLLVITIVPTALIAIWFGVMGNAAAAILEQAPQLFEDLSASQAVYTFLHQLPAGDAFAGFVLLLSALFLITSGAPMIYVLAEFMYESVTTPSRGTIVLWGVALGTTLTVVSAQSGITAMQELAISVSIPFSFIYLTLMIAFLARSALDRLRRVSEE